jgi:hypothetical protein
MLKALPIRTLTFGLTLASLVVGSAEAAINDEQTCRRVFYTLIDFSGSYEPYRALALADLKRLVTTLRAGDCLIVKSIGTESFSDRNTLLVLPLPVSSRPIDPGHQQRLTELKVRAVKRLDALKAAPKDGYTDLWCSVFSASKVLQKNDGEKTLLIYSDLLDNQRRKDCQQVRMEGVPVSVRFVPRGNDPAAFERRIALWARAFKEAGAGPVQFFDVDGLAIGEKP